MSLKSTYTATPLPPGWTEHKAPTGHTYYYNAETKESTYKRPVATAPPAPITPATGYWQHQAVPQLNLSDPNVANQFMAAYAPPTQQQRGGFAQGGRGGGFQRPKPQPVDKPKSKIAIPGCAPWILVYTKYGRRFVYNSEKNASYWRIPEKLMPAILELDKERIRQKAEGKAAGPEQKRAGEGSKDATPAPTATQQEQTQQDYDSSEYEEVEVTDDDDDDDDDQDDNEDGGTSSKRRRTEEHTSAQESSGGPVEFTEADIAAQLAAMGAEYGDEDEDYYNDEDAEMYDAAPEISDSDARELFKDLLNDFNINPYSPWDKLLEEGKIIDDPRYTVLGTTKARKEVWEEWSRARIQEIKELRAKQAKLDPKIPYLQLLQEKATPKLYWPEFKRKYKKEEGMKDLKLSDKDREKLYREHVSRLKLPQSQLKSDLKKLLESVPLSQLNNSSSTSSLPSRILSDVRYISLDVKTRDAFIEAYISGLSPPPEGGEGGAGQEEDEAAKKAREERQKREKALQDRERAVAEEKRRQEKKLQFERAKLRDEQRELERAMRVDSRKGLQSQLTEMDKGKAPIRGDDKEMEGI